MVPVVIERTTASNGIDCRTLRLGARTPALPLS
jgi:hypothetical protein